MNRSIRRIHLGSALGLLISLPLATNAPAAAPLPPVLVQARQAIAAARSYRLTESTISTDHFGTTLTSFVATVVRQGKTLKMSIITKDRQVDGKKDTTDMVIGAKHTCIRLTGQGAWNCTMIGNMSSLLNSALSFTPTASKTSHSTFAPAGSRVVQGQDCAGFNEVDTSSSFLTHSTIWFSIASKLPVQVTSNGVFFNKANPSKDTTTMVWSNWNDPSLSIPNVGA